MKVKAASLIFDYSLYPRHQISSHHVTDIMRAIDAGEVLPPVVVDKKTKRIIDGFHRVTATLKRFGPDAEIEVEWRTYNDERQAILDAIRLNSSHGQKFSHYDQARCISLAEEFEIEPEQLAIALHITVERLGELRATKTAIGPETKLVPIKRTLQHLAGKQITQRQMDAQEKAVGHHQMFLLNQVANLIEGGLLDHKDERVLDRLAEIVELAKGFLLKHGRKVA